MKSDLTIIGTNERWSLISPNYDYHIKIIETAGPMTTDGPGSIAHPEQLLSFALYDAADECLFTTRPISGYAMSGADLHRVLDAIHFQLFYWYVPDMLPSTRSTLLTLVNQLFHDIASGVEVDIWHDNKHYTIEEYPFKEGVIWLKRRVTHMNINSPYAQNRESAILQSRWTYIVKNPLGDDFAASAEIKYTLEFETHNTVQPHGIAMVKKLFEKILG